MFSSWKWNFLHFECAVQCVCVRESVFVLCMYVELKAYNPQAFRAGSQIRSDPIRIISQNYPGLVKMEGVGDVKQRGMKMNM